MDPHLLRTFVTVVHWRSFSAAAEELGYTQSAVSQQIAALEADLGLALLHRRPVRPTPAGERLLEHAGPLLLRHRAARADVLRAATGPIERLSVVASPLACTPAIARSLARERLAVTLRTAGRESVAEQIASGAADLGFVDGIAAPSDPLRLPDAGSPAGVGVAEEELVVVLPTGHPLSRRRGLALADLADALWLQAPAAVSVERLRELSGVGGFRVGFHYDGEDLRTVLNLAAAGHGLTLLPSSVTAGVPLSAPRVVHRVEMLHSPLAAGPAAAVAGRLG
ncbi:DNA-binding transcriptional LysR family regulator [Streptosporangium album]|uniref:DNA-binding transcriptional LysR family regulator n=1 Tax=Streptosporangium album TaxID=47479 RepID=A0A7W7S4A8_9ACTN|nr:LysR family transcriptional regulator [Streptosporangium album]MBB4943629.1 DNA-binding transcriptional LysR family regulator [Streptosporangium album]